MASRLTFREKCPSVCWQKQLRDKYLSEGTPPVALDLKKAIVRPISRKIAEQVILKYEWLGTCGPGVEQSYGIFFDGLCGGVTMFSGGGSIPVLAKTFKIKPNEFSYLCRGACVHWAPENTNSRLISKSLFFESKRGKKLAIGFADSDAGEIGTVYQASGWVCVGKPKSTWNGRQWISDNGRIYSFNAFTSWMKRMGLNTKTASQKWKENGWQLQDVNPKYRYVKVLDKSNEQLKSLINSLRQPYPKRPPIGGAEAPTSGGGSIPTRTLQVSANEN